MIRLIFLFSFLVCSFTISAQELSENLEDYQVTTVGDRIIMSGFKPLSKGTVFIAVLCDKELKIINRYQKALPEKSTSFSFAYRGNLFVYTFYGYPNKEKFRIALDENFLEKYASAPAEKSKSSNAEDPSLNPAGDWTYDPSYCNDYIIDDLLIDAQMDAITCYSMVDAIQGTYKKKWEKAFDNYTFIKMDLISVEKRTAYYCAVQSIPEYVQILIAIDIDNGTVNFTTELNNADSLDAIAVSNLLVKDETIYVAGTYILHETNQRFSPMHINNDDNRKRGYDELAPYILAEADGYYVMSLNAKTGVIEKMKSWYFPSINKTVDNRDYRVAVCHEIKVLSSGNILAFFELISTPYKKGLSSGPGFGSGVAIDNQRTETNLVKWESDAFISMIFNADFTEFNPITTIWDEESCTYNLSDYDLFSSAPRRYVPHDYCTLGDGGCYPQNFVCDGTTWYFHVTANDSKLPDFIMKGNEVEQKSMKLLPPGLLVLRDNHSGLQVKDMGQTIKLKIYIIN